MKKVPIEDYKAYTRPIPSRVDYSTGMVYVMSYDVGIICLCSNLSEAERIAHCLNTHQQLLDALKDASEFIHDGVDEDDIRLAKKCRKAIEAASFVEVQE